MSVCSLNAQPILLFDAAPITVEKGEEKVSLPIEVTANNIAGPIVVTMTITATTIPVAVVVPPAPVAPLEYKIEESTVTVSTSGELKYFYLVLNPKLEISNRQTITVQIAAPGAVAVLKVVNIIPARNLVYTLSDYKSNQSLFLEHVIKVESSDNLLTLTGYKNKGDLYSIKRKITLKIREGYSLKESESPGWLTFAPKVSLITVPFKMRSAREGRTRVASSGVTNLGPNFDFFGYRSDRYLWNGKRQSKRIAVGVWVAPAVEDLDSINTRNKTKDFKSKQFVISTAFNITFAFNNLTFIVVPYGKDYATTSLGKDWIYNKKSWWGFGIGLDPKWLIAVLGK